MLGRQISIRVTQAELKRLQREANSRSVSVSTYIRRAIYEYLSEGCELPAALFTEEATATVTCASTIGNAIGPSTLERSTRISATAQGALAFARRDEEIAAAIEAQVERISKLREDVHVLSVMVEGSYFGFLAHTPEIDKELRPAGLASARRRLESWRESVKAMLEALHGRHTLFVETEPEDSTNREGQGNGRP